MRFILTQNVRSATVLPTRSANVVHTVLVNVYMHLNKAFFSFIFFFVRSQAGLNFICGEMNM